MADFVLDVAIDSKTSHAKIQAQIQDIFKKINENPPSIKAEFDIDNKALDNFRKEITKIAASVKKIKIAPSVAKPNYQSTNTPGVDISSNSLGSAKQVTKARNDVAAKSKAAVNVRIQDNKNEQKEVSKNITLLRQYDTLLKNIAKNGSLSAAKTGKSAKNYINIQNLVEPLKTLRSQFDAGALSAEEFEKQLSAHKEAFQKNNAVIIANGENVQTLGTRFGTLAAKFASWLSVSRIIMSAYQSVRKMISVSIELDDALTQLQIVTRENDAAMSKFSITAIDTAKKIGANVNDVINSATTYARLGYNLNDSAKLSEYTGMLQNVGDIDVASAQDAITSIVKAFDIDTDQIESTLDKLVITGNNFPISVSQIAEGMTNASSTLSAAGNSYEQSVALLTAANTTLQNAAKSSTGLRTIAARIRNTKADLDELGESMTTAEYDDIIKQLTHLNVSLTDANGEYRSTYDIMKDIADKWKDLSSQEQASIANTLAGTRQQSVFYSIIEQFKEASGSMDAMSNSAGTLQDSYSTYMDSATAHINRFNAAYQELSSTMIDGKLITVATDLGTTILSIISGLQKVNILLPLIISSVASFKNVGRPKMSGLFEHADGDKCSYGYISFLNAEYGKYIFVNEA